MQQELTLAGKTILLAVTGGIAVYKSCELVRLLMKRGADVRVVMTENAAKFVTPLTFEALSGHPVVTSEWDTRSGVMPHIRLSDGALDEDLYQELCLQMFLCIQKFRI